MTVPTDVWLAVGYASFLFAVSIALRRLARRTARGPRLSSPGRGERDEHLRGEDAPWPHSDAAAFERGLSTVLEVLAVFILTVIAMRHALISPLAVGALLLVMLVLRLRPLRRLRDTIRQE